MKKCFVLVIVSLIVLCYGQMTQAVTVVQDTFTQTAERVDEAALDGTRTEVGSREWYNRSNGDCYRFDDPDGIPGNADDNIRRAEGGTTIWVALVDYLANPAGETITVSGDFYMNAATTESQQAALALFPSGTDISGNTIVKVSACTLAVRIYNNTQTVGYPDGYNVDLICRKSDTEIVQTYVLEQSIFDNLDVAWQPMVMTYNTATGLLNATINGNPLFTNVDVHSIIADWTPDIAYAGFYLRDENDNNRFDNFKIESDNPLSNPPTMDVVQSVGTSNAALSWITVDTVAWRPTDGLIPANHDFDAEWARFQDPNGPVKFEYLVNQGDAGPTTIAEATALTADFDLSTGVSLDYNTRGLDPASLYHFTAGVTTHAGPDVVILVDRNTDFVCSAVDFDIAALDIADNSFPGQSITVSCGTLAWNTFPGDMGSVDHYQVADNDPFTLQQLEATEREQLVAIALDYEAGMTLGGITIIPQSSQIRVMEVFALPATGGTPWVETSCQAGVYLSGDIDKDCDVDLDDFARLAQGWLGCNDMFNPACWN